MANFTQYCAIADVKTYGGIQNTDTADDVLITAAINAVQNFIDTFTRWSFQDEVRSNEERAFPDVKVDEDGRLQIRVDKCPVTAVQSVAYRFAPNAGWTTVDASLIEIYPTPSTLTHPVANSNLIVCYTALARGKVRVKLSYQGGFTGTTPPATLNWLATRFAWWRFTQRNAPFEKTANPALGQIIIPAALPVDLRMELEQWKRWA